MDPESIGSVLAASVVILAIILTTMMKAPK